MKSPHGKVCDEALNFWKGETVRYLTKFNKDVIWTKLFSILHEELQTKSHWNKDIFDECQLVYDTYQRLDKSYWDKLVSSK